MTVDSSWALSQVSTKYSFFSQIKKMMSLTLETIISVSRLNPPVHLWPSAFNFLGIHYIPSD